MNGVQATMLAATASAREAGLALSGPSRTSARDSSPTGSSFKKHLKKACRVQRDNPPCENAAQERSEPVKADTDSKTRDNQVEQVQEQPYAAKPGENQDTEKGSGSETPAAEQTGSSSSAVAAQLMAGPFMGMVKLDSGTLQQGTPAGEASAAPNAQTNSEVGPLPESNPELFRMVSQVREAPAARQNDIPAAQPGEAQTTVLAVNDQTTQATAPKMDVAREAAPAEVQNQTAGKREAGWEAGGLKGQVMDEKAGKKTEGEADSPSGKKLAEFESQRVSVLRPAKDGNPSEDKQAAPTQGKDAPSSPVLQQLETAIPKVQERNVPTGVQNSRVVVDPQDLMDQVVKKAEVMLMDKSSEMTLELKPGFLGKMTIKIAVDEAGTVTAHFSTSSQQVKNALEQNMQTLRQTLEAQGMKVDRTEVNVQLDSGGMMSDPGGRQDLWQQQSRAISFTGFSDSKGETDEAASQFLNPAQVSGYEGGEISDGYNFLV